MMPCPHQEKILNGLLNKWAFWVSKVKYPMPDLVGAEKLPLAWEIINIGKSTNHNSCWINHMN